LGWQLKDGSAVESQTSYSYGATDGRLSQISNPQISNTFTYAYLPNSSLIESLGSVPNGANLRLIWDRAWAKRTSNYPARLIPGRSNASDALEPRLD
jgi:hypothetical protein